MGVIIMNGGFGCDTFLIVGGTLVTYVYFKNYNGQSLTFSAILRHYIHRIVRLTPALAGVVLVSATLLRYMGSGPKWPHVVMGFEESCKKYWWSALLFIQNIVNVDEMCVLESWYLNVDMQLYIFSPLIFWILSKYSKAGMTILFFATISSIFLGFIRASKDEKPFDYAKEYYYATETRAAPWIMGTMLGYILTKRKFTQISLSKKITLLIWILTFAILLVSVFSNYGTGTLILLPQINNPFYIVLVRPAFAAAVGWIIWACTTNHGGIINDILSLSIFQFLNKFIYSMYLIHLTSLSIITYSSQTSLYVSNFNVIYWFWGIFMFAFGMSIIWILVFEMPIIAIEEIILSAAKTKDVTIKEEITKKEEIIKNST